MPRCAIFFDGNALETFGKGHGIRAGMGLQIAHRHVETLLQYVVRFLEHRVGLADAGGVAEENLKLAARIPRSLLRLGDLPENGIGISSRREIFYRHALLLAFILQAHAAHRARTRAHHSTEKSRRGAPSSNVQLSRPHGFARRSRAPPRTCKNSRCARKRAV